MVSCELDRRGEFSRNVRSVIDPPLPCLCSVGLVAALPFDEFDSRRCMRLVWMEAGLVGDVVCDLRAVAAAADERFALAARLARKACTAAVEAAEETGGALACYLEISVSFVVGSEANVPGSQLASSFFET